jgi:comEA protein
MLASFGHGYEDPGKPAPGAGKARRRGSSPSGSEVTEAPDRRFAPVRSEVVDAAALAVIVVLAVLVGLGVHGPIRGALAIVFFTFVPGWAIVTNWRSPARFSRAALSVLLSLAICTAVATTALWLRFWSPVGLFYVTASACAVAITSSLVRRRASATPELAEGPRVTETIEAADEASPAAVLGAPKVTTHPVNDTQVLVPRQGGDGIVRPPVGVASGTTTERSVNVNTASTAELQTLPGIGRVLAQRIVDHRTVNGPFPSVEQLLSVKGIGNALLASVRHRVSL